MYNYFTNLAVMVCSEILEDLLFAFDNLFWDRVFKYQVENKLDNFQVSFF